ncbi:MAG: 2-C-methyl-D-erythritol 2,4-cyclodiphosphate synthase [Bacteroidetes bacterium]|nr:2-C-methyl-D-erythritol 2,4-cyclodiphosphate synthase [Bacteroidota bacterium]MCL6102646.1 2-C-methyl-D-erythritol 2,4-cyclodiphosphate synthase [Bacteroidota bacterium]
MNIRIGLGYDVHQLATGEELWLGGILIPHEKGTVAHSDGDVLLHAICDALLGAAGLRDIGYHFPDTDAAYKNIDSKKLLAKVLQMVKEKGYRIGNLDATISAQRPKLKEWIPAMESVVAQIIETTTEQVNIKATTTEKLGFEGREEGISVQAVVLIEKLS